MKTDEEIKKILAGDLSTEDEKLEVDRVALGLRRTRQNLSQQQTMGFVLVKMWIAIANFLAPFFASLAKRQAREKAKKFNTVRVNSPNPQNGEKQ